MTKTSADPLTHQTHMYRIVIERIEVAHLKSIRDGLKDPAVLVLDVSDPTAREIVRTANREDKANRFVERAEKDDGVPIALWHMSVGEAANLLPPDHSGTIELLQDWGRNGPPSSFPVIVVAAGAISLVSHPVP